MKRTTLFGLTLFAAAILSAEAAFAADPSLHEVYQAAEAGHLNQAETMMGQVLRDHPNSAKAHFVEAELLAKEGRLDMARSELATAERLSPSLPFANRDAIETLKLRLSAPTRLAPSAAPLVAAAPANNFPWSLILVGLALIAAVIFFIRSLNRSRVFPSGGAGYAPAGTGYVPNGYPQPAGVGSMGQVAPVGGGMGSGILGGLATGAAMGAGLVAGEALMHRVFDGGSGHATDVPHQQPPADYPATSDDSYGMGGNDFGVSDGGTWDDNSAGGGISDDWS
jgi:hypothetical protein